MDIANSKPSNINICAKPTILSNAWNNFISHIRNIVNKAAYNNWFVPIKILDENDQMLFLETSSIYVEAYIKDNFSQELQFFFNTNKPIPIKFVVTQTTQKNPVKQNVKLTKLNSNHIISNHKYGFENFIDGPHNKFAKNLAIQVANNPGIKYNPLFIYGGIGSGKTHLLHAIANHICSKQNKKIAYTIKYITVSNFINELVQHLRNKSLNKFKGIYAHTDVLLIDDIQFLEKKEIFMNELCEQIETFITNNKQVVIAADKQPSLLNLHSRFVGRISSGIVTEISKPDISTIVELIQYKSQDVGLNINPETAMLIATQINTDDIRQIAGAVNTIAAKIKCMDTLITPQSIQKVLHQSGYPLILKSQDIKKIQFEKIHNILNHVCAYCGTEVQDVLGLKKTKGLVQSRQITIYLCTKLLPSINMSMLSKFFHRQHSTILHSRKSINKKIAESIDFDSKIESLIMNIKNQPHFYLSNHY